MRESLNGFFLESLDVVVRSVIAPVDKLHQLYGGETDAITGTRLQFASREAIWLPSAYEVFGAAFDFFNESESLASATGYMPFQYQAYYGNDGNEVNAKAIKRVQDGTANRWWLRSAYGYTRGDACNVGQDGRLGANYANNAFGVAPCFAV